MVLNIWMPGEQRYNSINVYSGDIVQVKAWNGSVINGKVVSVKDTTMNVEDVEIINTGFLKLGYDHKAPIKFSENSKMAKVDLDEIYGIDIDATNKGTKCLIKFIKDINKQAPMSIEQYTKIIDKNIKNKEYKLFLDNIIQAQFKSTLKSA